MTNAHKADKKLLIRYNDAHLAEDLKLIGDFAKEQKGPAFIAAVKIAAAYLRSIGYNGPMTWEKESEINKKIQELAAFQKDEFKGWGRFWDP